MFYRKLTLILFTLLIMNLPLLKGKADTPFDPGTGEDGGLSYALGVYNDANIEMTKKWKDLDKLEIQFAMLGVQWDDNEEDMAENAIALGNAVGFDALASAAALITTTANEIKDIADAHSLKVAMVNKAIEIEAQNVVVATAVTEQGRAHAHYKAHYDEWKKRYSGSKKFIKRGSTPSSVAIGNPAVSCKNPQCTSVFYASVYGLNHIITLAQGGSSGGYKGHRHTCNKAHVYWETPYADPKLKEAVSSPYSWWVCPPNTSSECPLSYYHKRKCPGVCGEYNVIKMRSGYGVYYDGNPDYHHAHKVDCKEEIPRSLSSLYLFNECHGTYYSCAGVDTCTNASNHVDDDDDDDSTESQYVAPEPTPEPSTPSYHACGVHETSVSGTHSAAGCGVSGHYACDGTDHSLQASCTSTDENGEECDVTGFYACQSHTHVYPAPTITCARDGCDDVVNHAYKHVTRCSSCNNQYWTCGSNTERHETPLSCRRSGCSNTFTRCSIPSSCPAAPNWKCWP